ncbi:4-fold beta flower protein [Bradyrhizobium sp. CCGB01]|uniref:4-fold beta flower protein n=1 Tax=Bradyrhizobium sp. CCGB01 TaxID=2949634 RepID=UPI0035C6A192
MAKDLYDRSGRASHYIDDDGTMYTCFGQTVGFVKGESVYTNDGCTTVGSATQVEMQLHSRMMHRAAPSADAINTVDKEHPDHSANSSDTLNPPIPARPTLSWIGLPTSCSPHFRSAGLNGADASVIFSARTVPVAARHP